MRILSILVKLYDHLFLDASTSATPNDDPSTLRDAARAELTALTKYRQDSRSPATNEATLANAWNEVREVESIIVGVERAVLASLRSA